MYTSSFPLCLPPFPISVLTFSPLPAAEALFDVFQSEDLPYGVPLVVIATRQVLIHHHNVVVVVVVPSLGSLTYQLLSTTTIG